MRILFILLFVIASCKPVTHESELSDTVTIDTVIPVMRTEPHTEAIEQELKMCISYADVPKNPITAETEKMVTDTISDRYDNTPDIGYISYNVPDSMRVGEYYKISLKSSEKFLGVSEQHGSNSVPSTTFIETVRVSRYMSAKIIDTDNTFWIKEMSTNEQIVDSGTTEWLWAIKPLKSGSKELRMAITIRVDGQFSKDVPVFDRVIFVERSLTYNMSQFFGSYWQWLLSTILIPVFVYYRKRKK